MQTVTAKGFRLSFQQKYIWQCSQAKQIEHTQCAITLQGALDPVVFQQALQHIVDHYEILHTTFYTTPGMDLPMQVLTQKGNILFSLVDSAYLDAEKQGIVLEEHWRDLQNYPFDLKHGPQLHAVLLRTASQSHTLIVSLPAICADIFTLRQLIPLLLAAYEAVLMKNSLPVDENELQYIDVSSWQDDLLQSEEREELQAFWHKMKLSRLTDMPLPFQHASKDTIRSQREGQTHTFQARHAELPLDATLQHRLLEISQHSHISPEAYLLASWQILLWRLTDESPLIGLVCDGRPHEELTQVLGPNAWTVPFALSTQFSERLTFEWVLRQTQQVLQEATEKQLYFGREMLNTEQSQEEHVFPISFAYGTWLEQWQRGPLQARLLSQSSWSEPSQLLLQANLIGEHFHLQLRFDPTVFSLSVIQQMAGIFSTLLRDALTTPDAHIGSLALLTPEEQVQQRERMCGPQSDWPFVPLHKLFQLQAQKRPDAPAIRSGEICLSYQEIEQQTNQLAHLLLAKGLQRGDRVALYQHRDQWALISLLGVLKAGGCYVPLDEDLPSPRVNLLLQQMAPALLLCSQDLAERVEESTIPVLQVERYAELIHTQPTSAPLIEVAPEDLAYIMYTSGSTGIPKGVEIRQGSVSNYIQALCELLKVEANWHFATVSSLAADLGNTTIFCGLASGGCVHVLSYTLVTDGAALADYVEQYPIDVLKIVPSHLLALMAAAEGRVLPKQRLILGGEALPWSLVQELQKQESTCYLYNHYGPTEATIGALVNPLGSISQLIIPLQEERGSSVPIGRPISNMYISIRDGQRQRVPQGISAELYLAGAGLAAGYLGAQELTSERFVELEDGGQRQRWYRTGDIVRENAYGQIEFVGRQDSQVKLRGYRIELAEIETYLRRHPDIREAVVDLKEGQLVGYIVPWKKPGPDPQEVREALLTEMPRYLVPSKILQLEHLPLTSNGKVDRQHLPVPIQEEKRESAQKRDEGRTPIEEVILGIWRQVLGMHEIQRTDDFFQLGGHSLLGTRVIARLRTIFGREIPITWLFDTPTVAGLAKRIEEVLRQEQGISVPPLVPASRQQPLLLSFAQQRLWFLDQLEPGSTTYTIPQALRLRGPLDRIALQKTLHAIIQRHENLRTTFPQHDGQPIQQIHPQPLADLIVLDLSTLAQQERDLSVQQLTQQEAEQPFDLVHGPLLRSWLLHLVTQQEHVLLLSMHHIISDGWSSGILFRELSHLYLSFLHSECDELPLLPIQYADYALWQRSWLQGEVLAQQVHYWKEQLSGLAPLNIPTDRPRPAIQTFEGALQQRLFPAHLHQQLLDLSQREGVTLFMTLLAAFQVLLARYSGQGDIAVGTPIANRTHEEVEGLIGFFVNTLVLRSDLSDNPSFLMLLARVRTMALGAYTHQDIPFEQVVEALQPQRDLSRSPLFQVFFELQNISGIEELSGPLELQSESVAQARHNAKFELSIVIAESEEGLQTTLEYNTDLFEASTIDHFLDHFQVLLESIVCTPEQHIATLSLLTPAAYQQLVLLNNQTQQELTPPLHYMLYLAQQVARAPERVAICDQDQQLTYADLWQRAEHVAIILQQQGVKPETLVGLYMERSCELLISILAIWRCAAAYVPLDPAYPRERLHLILTHAQLSIILTTNTLQSHISTDGIQLLCIEELNMSESATEEPLKAVKLLPQHLAYVIYTSGSTGTPKGVMISQEGMLNHLWAKIFSLALTENDVIAQTASACFDISVWQLLAASLQSGKAEILPNTIAHDPRALLQTVQEKMISILQVVPSMLAVMLDEPVAADLDTSRLRWLIVTGEAMPKALSQRWWNEHSQIPLLNAYGPTECSDDVTHALLQEEQDVSYWRIPIGVPIINTQIYLLDAHMQLVPQGVIGEIYVGGGGIGRGYLYDAERTAEVFVPDPYSAVAGSRLYRTGDRGRYRQDGQLEFVERYDGQVKLRGYRIELGEIEERISRYPQVKQNVVIIHENAPQEKHLVAYIVGEGKDNNSIFNIGALEHSLKAILPEYMIPDHFILLETLPLTPNGKVNRSALPEPEWTQGKEEENTKQLYPVEELVLQIWKVVLQREHIGLQENFFEIGGHSLLATQIVARLRKVIPTEIPLLLLFEAPTISSLAARLQQQLQHRQVQEIPPLLPVDRTQDLPLSFAQQRLWFLHQFAPLSAAYTIPIAVRLHGQLDTAALLASLSALIQRHESLRTLFEERHGQLVQRIIPHPTISFPLIDLSFCPEPQREDLLQWLVQQEGQQPFDLTRGPLLRSWLLRISSQDHILLLTMHHIVSDGWSMTILVQEFTRLYQAFREGAPSPFAPLSIQYADYAHWQRTWLQGEILKEQIRYWTQQLQGAHALELPTDYPRPQVPSQRGAQYGFKMDAELALALNQLSLQAGTTLFMTLLAAFQVLLYRLSGEEDIVVGTDSANRSQLETEGLIGFFVNLLALRTTLHDHPSFIHLLQRVREMVLAAYAHQELPFEMIIEHLRLPREGSRTPLINVLFVMQNVPLADAEFPDIAVHSIQREGNHAKFDMALFLAEGSTGFYGSVNYNTDLFTPETIATLIRRYEALLRSIVKQPHMKIASLEIATEDEKAQKTQQQTTLRQHLKISRGERLRISREDEL